MTIKICSKFNTIEWETDDLPSTEELQEVYDVLSAIEVKDEDMPQRAVKKTEAPKRQFNDKPASEAQLRAMSWMGVKIPKDCTMQEARAIMMRYNQEHPKD